MACTSARNERTFSSAGRLLDNLRSSLDASLVGDILYVQRNLHLLHHTMNRTTTYSTAAGGGTSSVDHLLYCCWWWHIVS
eukprot:2079413-Pleurochrysis_carterae.AAC.3